MASLGMQMLASALCLLGWFGVLVCCILPMWRVTAFVGSTIVTSQKIWEGIWMTCVAQSTGQIQCKPYDSMLALGSDLQAARALTVLAIVTGAGGLVLAFIGGKCTRFMDGQGGAAKGKVAVAAGAVLIATGVLCLIPTSWAASAVVRTFYSASIDAQRRELGACLYIGWGASILLVLGGALFINSACPLKPQDQDKSPSVRYLVVRSSDGSAPARARPPAVRARSQDPVSKRPPWEDRPDLGQDSENSWSHKSQMKRPESAKSEASEPLSTKSQLQRADQERNQEKDQEWDRDKDPGQSESEDASSNQPTRTYI